MPCGRPPRSATKRRNAPTPQPTSSTRLARRELHPRERGLVVRDLLVLAQRPVRGPRAPQRAPALCTSGDGGRCHLRFLLDYEP